MPSWHAVIRKPRAVSPFFRRSRTPAGLMRMGGERIVGRRNAVEIENSNWGYWRRKIGDNTLHTDCE